MNPIEENTPNVETVDGRPTWARDLIIKAARNLLSSASSAGYSTEVLAAIVNLLKLIEAENRQAIERDLCAISEPRKDLIRERLKGIL